MTNEEVLAKAFETWQAAAATAKELVHRASRDEGPWDVAEAAEAAESAACRAYSAVFAMVARAEGKAPRVID